MTAGGYCHIVVATGAMTCAAIRVWQNRSRADGGALDPQEPAGWALLALLAAITA